MKELDYNTVLTKITYLTKRNDITQTELGSIIGLDKAAANKRAKRNSKFSDDEIKDIENYFKISFSDIQLVEKHSSPILTPSYSLGVQYELEQWGKRLLMLQVASNMLDSRDFAKFIDISEKRLDDFIRKNKYPTGEELLKLKIRFSDTDFDWLLFGNRTT